ncbi:hypothetical protein UT300005_18040 [Clostridium sp. CTA-5]
MFDRDNINKNGIFSKVFKKCYDNIIDVFFIIRDTDKVKKINKILKIINLILHIDIYF